MLNATFLRKFLAWFGAESDAWIGRRVRVYRRQQEMTNAKGVTRSKWVRDVVCEDRLARAPVHRAPVVPWPSSDASHDDLAPADDEVVRERTIGTHTGHSRTRGGAA